MKNPLPAIGEAIATAATAVGKAFLTVARGVWLAVKWGAQAIAIAAAALGRAALTAGVALWPWVVGILVFGGPYVLLETVAPSDVGAWSAAYIAGAAGGLILEMIRSRWNIEEPSHVPKRTRGPAEFGGPTGPRVDIGIFGRLTTSAIAAPTFLIVINSLDNTDPPGGIAAFLGGIADRPDTLAWAVLIGAVSPVAWKAGESFVKTRFAVADTQLEIQHETVKQTLAKLKEQQEKTRPKVKEARKKRKRESQKRIRQVTPALVAAGIAVGEEHGESPAANGHLVDMSMPGDEEMSEAIVAYDGALSEAIGALSAVTATKAVRDRERRER